MGYCSKIGILVTLPRGVKAKAMVNNLFKKWDKDEFKQCFEVKESHSEFNYVYIHTTRDLKWYESFKDVGATMKFIRNFENHYKTGGLHFVRIGEDIDDIEEEYKGNIERYIYVERWMSALED